MREMHQKEDRGSARNRNGGEVFGSRAEKQLLLKMLENDRDDGDGNQEDQVSQGSSLADELGDMAEDLQGDDLEEPDQVTESSESPEKQRSNAEGKQQKDFDN